MIPGLTKRSALFDLQPVCGETLQKNYAMRQASCRLGPAPCRKLK